MALPGSPALRVEFQILNNPTLLRNGTKVLSVNGMMGKGAVFMTLDPIKVRLIKGNDFSDLQNELVVVIGCVLLKGYNIELSAHFVAIIAKVCTLFGFLH